MDGVLQLLVLGGEVFLLDLVLSGDNAVVIGLACRGLPVPQRRRVMVAGTAIAIALRIVLTLLVSFVLRVPVLKLLGGIALAAIAVRLTLQDQRESSTSDPVPDTDVISVLGAIVIADLAMSTDNVVALAALVQGNVAMLALGLVLSIPLLMFGSWYVTVLLQRYPALTPLAGAMLGWLAGDIAMSDPLYAGWIAQQSPALNIVVPLLSAAYVLGQARIVDKARASAAPMRPAMAPRHGQNSRVVAEDVQRFSTQPPLLRAPEGNPGRISATAGKSGARRRVDPWAIGAGVLAVLATGAVLLNAAWLPVPGGLAEYDCGDKGYILRYRQGGDRIRLAHAGGTVSGIVRPDNQIDWGDLHGTSTELGFVPPTVLAYADARTLRVDGGMAGGVVCQVH